MRPYKPKKGQPPESYNPKLGPPPYYKTKEGNLRPSYKPLPGKKTSLSMKRTRVPKRKTFLLRPGDTVEVENTTSRCLVGRIQAYGPGDLNAIQPSAVRYLVVVDGQDPQLYPASKLRLIRGGPKGTQPIPSKKVRYA